MKGTRRNFVRTVATASVLAPFASSASATGATRPEELSLTEEFDALQADWRVASDLATPATPGYWDASIVAPASMSSRTVRFVADGASTTGTTWIYAPVSVDPGTAYEGSVTARMWSPGTADEDLSRLHVCLGPEKPESAADFPDPRESWFYHGERTGLDVSLWNEAGWNDYTAHWESDTVETDTLWLAIGVSTDVADTFAHHLDAVEVSLTPKAGTDGTTDGTLTVVDATVTTVDATLETDREVSFDHATGTVTVRGEIDLPNTCYEPTVLDASYDATADEATVSLGTVDAGDADTQCLQMVDRATYELVLNCDGGVPGAVTVSTPGGETVSAADAPTMTDVTLLDGDEKANGVEFDDATDTVQVSDTVELANGCQYVTVTDAGFDAATDTCTISVDVAESDDDYCTQQVTEQAFTVEATFDGGLPGTVDYVGPN